MNQRASLTRGNGVVTLYGYDAASRLASLAHDLAAAGHDQGVSFARNPASQITERATTNAAYRFTDHVNVDVTSVYNKLNQPTAIGGAAIAHDARGNLTSDGTTTYGYDIDNRLISGTGGAALKYDAGGRLVETAKTGSGATRFLYSGPELIGEYDASGTLQRRYAHGAGIDEPVVWYEGADASDRRWLVADERGSVVAVTDGAGAALGVNSYDVYGKPGAGNLGRFAYTGQTFIPEVGLYHYKARFYSPDLGRFMQTDPIGYEDQMNLYAYVGNDPVNATDPTGEFLNILVGAAAGALVGAVLDAGAQAIDDISRGEAISIDRGQVLRAAAVGAATGAIGPAGGTALRAALVGKGAASAAKAAATPTGKALVAVTDTAADLVGQPAIGAVDAALQGNDPGLGAVEGVGAAGAGAAVDAATVRGSTGQLRAAGARGTAVAGAKAAAKQVIKSVAASGGSKTIEQAEKPEIID